MKICSAAGAAELVVDNATLLVDGSGGGVNEPGAVLAAIEARYLQNKHPRDLTLVHVSGMGDGHGGAIDRFSHDGMVRRVVGGHWGWTPRMQQLAFDEKVEAYCLPQGTLSHSSAGDSRWSPWCCFLRGSGYLRRSSTRWRATQRFRA